MAATLKVFLFLVIAIACVFALPAEESERVKKQVYYGAYGYGAYPYAASAYAAPYAAAPLAYSAGYSAYPYAGYRSIYY